MRPARPKPRISIFAYETLSGLTENVDAHMTARMQCRYKRSLMWLQSSCIEAGDTQTLTNTHTHRRIWGTRQRRAEWLRWRPATRGLTRQRICSTTTPRRGPTSSGRTASCRGSWPACIGPSLKVRRKVVSLHFLSV